MLVAGPECVPGEVKVAIPSGACFVDRPISPWFIINAWLQATLVDPALLNVLPVNDTAH
jgi:hypothetical protein